MSLMSSQVLSTNEGSDVESGLGGDSKSIDWRNDEGQEGVVEVEDYEGVEAEKVNRNSAILSSDKDQALKRNNSKEIGCQPGIKYCSLKRKGF